MVLPAYSDEVSDFTLKTFKKINVDTYLRCRVSKITDKSIQMVLPSGETQEMPCGFVLWASGIGQVPFSKLMMSKIPSQQNNRPAVINVDEKLRIKGVPRGNVFALGDCSFLAPSKLSDHVDELYETAVASPSGAGTSFLKA